jgi:hypothetical protein
LEIEDWNSSFDFIKLKNIININSEKKEDIDYVKTYFYDKWDLKIIYKSKEVYVDIKTALTKLEPKSSWNFMYPVIQANKE